MPSVKTSQSVTQKRQKAQRESRQSLGIRRFFFITLTVGMFVAGLWGYFHLSPFMTELSHSAEQALASLGFKLQDVVVQGRIRTNKSHILETLHLEQGKPLFSINLSESKQLLENISWVNAVSIERRLPDTLYIRISEKCPLAIWLNNSKTFLLDKDGSVIETNDTNKYKELIIVTGDEAPKHVGNLVAMLSKYPQIKSRATGAAYLRSNRWDIKLDGKIDLKLPEKDPEIALTYLLELETKHHLMEREIMTIDMRLPEQLILRLTPEAAEKKTRVGHAA